MFAVIFEVQPKKERWDAYLELAKLLKPEIEKIDGFIDNDRFASQRTEGRLLSLSFWRDEKAVIRWRTLAMHHMVQEKGRFEVFEDYHLRVGEVIADDHAERDLPQQRLDETEVGNAKLVTISEVLPETGGKPGSTELGLPAVAAMGLVDQETYKGIYNPEKMVLLGSWRDAEAARAWRPRPPASATVRHRQVRIVRDYGMFDRREAPQYYPEVKR